MEHPPESNSGIERDLLRRPQIGAARSSACSGPATSAHYDRHFDTIARVSGQPIEWLACRGSLD